MAYAEHVLRGKVATTLCWYWKAKSMMSEHEAGQEGPGLTRFKNEVM